MGNASEMRTTKEQNKNPDQKSKNNPPMCLQHSEKIPHSESGFSWLRTTTCTSSVKIKFV